MDETHINHGKSMTIFDRTYHTLEIHEYPEIPKNADQPTSLMISQQHP
jgi:hypothetical protein